MREPALLVGPQAQDAVLDRSRRGRRAIRWHGEPHQLGAQPGGWLTEDDRAEHQLEQDPVEVRRHRAGTAGADGRGDFDFGCAAATVPDGRTIVAGAHEWGISRYDLLSGEAYPPAAGEQASVIWDVTMATLPGGRVMAAGAGYDGLVYRWTPRPASGSASRSGATAPSSRRSPRPFRPTGRRCSSPGARGGSPALGRGDRRPDRGTAPGSPRRCP